MQRAGQCGVSTLAHQLTLQQQQSCHAHASLSTHTHTLADLYCVASWLCQQRQQLGRHPRLLQQGGEQLRRPRVSIQLHRVA